MNVYRYGQNVEDYFAKTGVSTYRLYLHQIITKNCNQSTIFDRLFFN